MLQRHANFLGGLILGLDVLCLILAWAATHLFGWDTGRAILLFEGWNSVPIALLWIFSAWLFRFHRSPVLFRKQSVVRDLVAANSFFVGLVMELGNLLAERAAIFTVSILWPIG